MRLSRRPARSGPGDVLHSNRHCERSEAISGRRAVDRWRLLQSSLGFGILLGTVGVAVRAVKMQGDIGLVPDHPAIVSRRDVKDVSRAQFGDGAVVHRSSRTARNNDADMLD